MHLHRLTFGSLVDNVFSSKYCCAWLITMTKAHWLTTATNSNRNGSPVSFHVLTAPVKEFKKVNNSISRVIRVLIDKQRILSEVWDGSTTELTQKREGQSTKMPYVCPYILAGKYFGFNTFSKTKYFFTLVTAKHFLLHIFQSLLLIHQSRSDRCLFSFFFFFFCYSGCREYPDLLAASRPGE